ncbi:hypothetical protein DFA_07177 [Cavenderia fasciculata]|uniref:Uncharacterized protein n=1 Tax=Cavenderia fasciculata TaxID=261658 RepID=F4PVP6_CACFS|nr:uncharacterized protein DFA_07177 [Cavenderia fasciculata]EGG20060.1 hypothetical protein DFA_07177 [Cavenderia fasciculata]|eukprot:XP_004367043.1 hypothetical protein DFA_07177 [Cavenderia fasciculata]
MIQLTKINNVIVEPIKLPQPPKNVKGSELFNQLNANILVCAPKNSGKTVVIKKIIDECTNKQTNVLIFCATVHNDHNLFIFNQREISFSLHKKMNKNRVWISNDGACIHTTGLGGQQGDGFGDWFKRAYDFVKENKLISRGAKALGDAGVPYASKIGDIQHHNQQ